MNSRYYFRMLVEAQEIEKHYMPMKRLATYSIKQKQDARCYHVLVHAAIETYFEEIITHTINSAFYSWLKYNAYAGTLLHLLNLKQARVDLKVHHVVSHSTQHSIPVLDYLKQGSELGYEQAIKAAVKGLLDDIGDNNGIKGKNIAGLLDQIGYDINVKFPNLVLDLNQFGGTRGGYVHKATSLIKIDRIDPFLVKTNVNNLLKDIGPFDLDIQTLW